MKIALCAVCLDKRGIKPSTRSTQIIAMQFGSPKCHDCDFRGTLGVVEIPDEAVTKPTKTPIPAP